jgi:hypothetical protein
MNSYFFKLTKEEKENILDKHKSVYDGYVTEYGKSTNQQPLYVQDFANDKNGITVSNKGNVKAYTNLNINEDIDRTDRIGDGPHDLKNGTVDFRGVPDMSDVNREYFGDTFLPSEDKSVAFISLGTNNPEECKHCDDDKYDIVVDIDDIDLNKLDTMSTNEFEGFDNEIMDDVEPEEKINVINQINESLDMFRRFKKYN